MSKKAGLKHTSDKENREKTLLLSELKRTQAHLNTVQNNLEEICDPTLVDSHIYELKATQLRYQFLLNRMKQFGH